MHILSGEDESETFDTTWLRLWLRRCDLLEQMRAVTPEAKCMIRFAIQWAPFGGASGAELLVKFGVTRRRFVQLVLDALDPRGQDNLRVRALKRRLRTSLAQAWSSPSR